MNGADGGKQAAGPATGPAKTPISQHRAFPAIVALWFAALLGLGALVLPPVLLESFVTRTGISSLIPAAAPPLGFTAHLLLALAAGISGAVLGVVLARKVAAAQGVEPRSRHAAAAHRTAPRPINAHEELGEDGLAASGVKRRSLAITDESLPSDYLSSVPLPGDDHPALGAGSGSGFGFGTASPRKVEAAFGVPGLLRPEEPVADPLELGAFSDTPPEFLPPAFDEPEFEETAFALEPDPFEPDSYEDAAPMTDKQEFQPLSSAEEFELQVQEFHAPEAPETAGFTAALDAEPLAFSAPSLARTEMEAPVVEPVFTTAPAPLDDLGMGQLIQRLGTSIERRRELQAAAAQQAELAAAEAAAAAAVPATPPAAAAFEAARPEEAAQAMAAFFGKPAAIAEARTATAPFDLPIDAALAEQTVSMPVADRLQRTLSDFAAHAGDAPDDDADGEDEDFSASFAMPRGMVFGSGVDDVADSDAATEGGEQPGFSSLLELNNPLIHKETSFVRVDDPADEAQPASAEVVFPGADRQPETPVADSYSRLFDRPEGIAGPRKPSGEMDDALRSALAKLQRMSGAA
jgi:hypothetical protein